jgi:hypothetical protein
MLLCVAGFRRSAILAERIGEWPPDDHENGDRGGNTQFVRNE